jgi:hypothetical protein
VYIFLDDPPPASGRQVPKIPPNKCIRENFIEAFPSFSTVMVVLTVDDPEQSNNPSASVNPVKLPT